MCLNYISAGQEGVEMIAVSNHNVVVLSIRIPYIKGKFLILQIVHHKGKWQMF